MDKVKTQPLNNEIELINKEDKESQMKSPLVENLSPPTKPIYDPSKVWMGFMY
jgi:hypothetical protein